MWARIPEHIVMQYVDDELPWYWRVPVRAGVILSPGLRHQVRVWRGLSAEVKTLRGDRKSPVGVRARPQRPRRSAH